MFTLRVAFSQQSLDRTKLLVFDLLEKPTHAMVILLGPLIVGMLMAFGTGNPHTKKNLRSHRGHFTRFSRHLVKETRGLIAQGAFSGQ